ncbi:Uncharacterised protein [Mycobacterium tuberculosis]|nr:Uncharacterised protein [Mycobacterium tuberculosis]
MDHRDGDSATPQLLAQRIGETGDRVHGGGVAGESRKGLATHHRRHVHDPSRSLLLHDRQDLPHHAHRAEVVDLQHLASVVKEGLCVDRAYQRDAGVVEHDVNATKLADHVGNHGAHALRRRDVERGDHRPPTRGLDLPGNPAQRTLAARRQGDHGALTGECLRGRLPDAAGGTGDQHHLVTKSLPSHHLLLSWV